MGARRSVTVMKTLAAFVFIMVGLSGCTSDSQDELQNRKLLYDAIDHEIVVKELRAQSIPFRVDPEGGIWYSSRDTKSVDAIMSRVKSERSKPASNYENPDDMRRFKELLNLAGIPFRTAQRGGREWVTWEERDEVRVRDIQVQVERESDERERRRRGVGTAVK